LVVLASTVLVALLAVLAISVHVQADLRSQRDDLRARLSREQRIDASLSKSVLDLQNAGLASYAGGGAFLLATTGTVRAAIAVVYTKYAKAAQPSVWLLLHATGADPHVVYSFTASACNGNNQIDLEGGFPSAGELHFAATNVSLPPDQAPYTVVLRGQAGRSLGGVKLASDRTVSVLRAGDAGC